MFVSGFYFCVALIVGLELTWDIFRLKTTAITPPMRLTGAAMLIDAAGSLADLLYYTEWLDYVWLGEFVSFCDFQTTGFLLLSGFSLLLGRYPKVKVFAGMVVLFALPMVLESVFGSQLWATVFFYAILLLISVGLIIRVVRFHNRLVFRYSNVSKYRVSWYVAFLVWILIIMPAYAFVTSYAPDNLILRSLVVFVMAVGYIIAGRAVYMQTVPTKEEMHEIVPAVEPLPAQGGAKSSPKLADSFLSKELQQDMLRRLHGLMAEEKLFRNADLCVDDLVGRLNTNSSYFYYFMRDVVGSNFFDFVNGYRVEEAKRLIQAGEKIDSVALHSGFNSSNSLRRAFKKFTGVTPSEWRSGNSEQ